MRRRLVVGTEACRKLAAPGAGPVMMVSDGLTHRSTNSMSRKVVAAQNVSRMCLVCGVQNVAGLNGRFLELEDGELLGVFQPRQEHQGYPGRLHGGIASAILDETIGRAITIPHPGTWGVTAELTVRYRRPIPLDVQIRAVGRISRDTSRLFEGAGEIVLEDGSVAATATGKYVKLELESIADPAFRETDWFPDARRHPGSADL